MGERLPGARVVEVPGVDHLPWEGDQKAVLDQIELFLGGLRRDAGAAGPGADDGARGRPAAVEESHLLDSVLSRFRGRELDAPPRPHPRASFDGPARARALRDRARRQRSRAAGRHPHGRVRAARRHAQRPRARGRRRRRPAPRRGRSSRPRRCRTSSRAPGSTSTTAARSATCACSACCADAPAGSARRERSSQQVQPWVRASAPKRRSTVSEATRGRLDARAISHWSPAASSQRPSGDHSRSSRRPCAGSTPPRTRISVPAALRTASASRLPP